MQYTFKEFINIAARKLNLPIVWSGKNLNEKARLNNKVIIEIDRKYLRPSEVDSLLGESIKAKKELKWKPSHNIESLVDDMINKNHES